MNGKTGGYVQWRLLVPKVNKQALIRDQRLASREGLVGGPDVRALLPDVGRAARLPVRQLDLDVHAPQLHMTPRGHQQTAQYIDLAPRTRIHTAASRSASN